MNIENPPRIFAVLDVVLQISSGDTDLEIRKEIFVDFDLDKRKNGERDTRSLELNFLEDTGKNITVRAKVGAQAVSWINDALLAVRLVAKDDEFVVGNMSGFVPINCPLSLHFSNKEQDYIIRCGLIYQESSA